MRGWLFIRTGDGTAIPRGRADEGYRSAGWQRWPMSIDSAGSGAVEEEAATMGGSSEDHHPRTHVVRAGRRDLQRILPDDRAQMRASGRPVEQIRRGETMAFIVINGIALSWSLYVFYAPWWKGKSRWEWFKAYLPRLLVPFIFVLVLRILTRWQDEASLSVLILLLLLVTGPVLLAAGLSVEIPRFLDSRRPPGRLPSLPKRQRQGQPIPFR